MAVRPPPRPLTLHKAIDFCAFCGTNKTESNIFACPLGKVTCREVVNSNGVLVGRLRAEPRLFEVGLGFLGLFFLFLGLGFFQFRLQRGGIFIAARAAR